MLLLSALLQNFFCTLCRSYYFYHLLAEADARAGELGHNTSAPLLYIAELLFRSWQFSFHCISISKMQSF